MQTIFAHVLLTTLSIKQEVILPFSIILFTTLVSTRSYSLYFTLREIQCRFIPLVDAFGRVR